MKDYSKFTLENIRKELSGKSLLDCIGYIEDLLLLFDQESTINLKDLAYWIYEQYNPGRFLENIHANYVLYEPLQYCRQYRTKILESELERYEREQVKEKILWTGEKQDFAFLVGILKRKGIIKATDRQILERFTSTKGEFSLGSFKTAMSQLSNKYDPHKLPEWLNQLNEANIEQG